MPIKIRIEQGEITLHKAGAPDRSIRKQDFIKGKVIPKRYRNRRLGDFLKELDLTGNAGKVQNGTFKHKLTPPTLRALLFLYRSMPRSIFLLRLQPY